MSTVLAGETEPNRPLAKLFSLADARADVKIVPPIDTSMAYPPKAPRIVWDNPGSVSENEAREGDPPSKWSKIVLCLNVACLTATVSIGAILTASYQPLQTIAAMNDKLGVIEGAEQRLRSDITHSASRTDGLIQLRMDHSDAAHFELLTGLGGLRDSVAESSSAMRQSDVRVEDQLSDMMMSLADLQTAVSFSPETRKSGPKTIAAVLSSGEGEPVRVPAPTRSPGASRQASSKFERHEMPDGSVAYRRIQ
ncbi:hypothetical protein [Fulvimarina sp. MAC3]|uniref:hypothetical protein n=1 Tax=Fulvimarina sp. MAC3 TaxID=3148887 RepID=UPI0031FC7BFB